MIVLKKEIIDCVLEHRKNRKIGLSLPNDHDGRIKRSIQLREKYSHLIPIVDIDSYNIYLDALDNERYDICKNFKIVDK